MLRILRLLRVLKLKYFLYKLEEYIITDFLNFFTDLLKVLSTLLLLSHVMA